MVSAAARHFAPHEFQTFGLRRAAMGWVAHWLAFGGSEGYCAKWELNYLEARRPGPRIRRSNSPQSARFHHFALGPGHFSPEDFHDPLREFPEVRRRLREVYEERRDRRKFAVIARAAWGG
jgi:hypothetical protein